MSELDAKIEPGRVLVAVTIAAPLVVVWRAVRDPEQLQNWFGWDADTLKAEIAFIFADHAHADEVRHILQFDEYEGMQGRFELVAVGNSTLLRVVRAGPAPPGWADVYEDVIEGWISFVEQLRLLLEKHRGATRRTLYLSGRAAAGHKLPVGALGLAELRAPPIGSIYSADIATGDHLTGSVWHRSRHQLGLSVDGFGEGLLIVTDRPPGAVRPMAAAASSSPASGWSRGPSRLSSSGLAPSGRRRSRRVRCIGLTRWSGSSMSRRTPRDMPSILNLSRGNSPVSPPASPPVRGSA